MILQEARAFGCRQSGLRGAQDKGVGLTAKDNGGVEGGSWAWRQVFNLPCWIGKLKTCRHTLGQTVHFVAQLRELFLKALDAGAQVRSSGGFFLQITKSGADQAQGQTTGLQTAGAPFAFSLRHDAFNR